MKSVEQIKIQRRWCKFVHVQRFRCCTRLHNVQQWIYLHILLHLCVRENDKHTVYCTQILTIKSYQRGMCHHFFTHNYLSFERFPSYRATSLPSQHIQYHYWCEQLTLPSLASSRLVISSSVCAYQYFLWIGVL